MSEELQTTPAPAEAPAPELSRAEKIDAAWQSAQDAPAQEITPEALDEKPAAPERESVAPSIREFIRAQKPAEPGPTSALEQEIAELRGALDALRAGGQQQPEPTREELVLSKLEDLQRAQLEAQEADAAAKLEEQHNQRIAALRDGAIENINARSEDFPGLVALEQQETVVNALFQRIDEGQETSEDEVASEVEQGLREVYEKLHKVYGSALSEATKPVSERPQTLTPDLSASTEPADLSKMTRRERIDYLWNKTNS